MKKRILTLLLAIFLLTSALYAEGAPELQLSATSLKPKVVASTSWTASFADLGGVDYVTVIAPPSLVHPPEYEITVKDVQNISKADYFIYAGYERMMKTMGESIKGDSVQMIPIKTDTSLATVKAQAKIIASVFGTEEESLQRVAHYAETLANGKKAVAEAGLQTKKVLCHSMQVYLAEELGLQIAGTFGPGPITAKQIADAAANQYDIIIDNIHNPVAAPLVEVSPASRLVVWRNFPESVKRGSLEEMVSENLKALLDE
ncbi:ABC-type metal ion transport system, periplasmic component/surface adhesin [Sphaerochaeta pleomorpha str. Grapes]|uniref:ABC-type metal ion transport system, periplasmic component/surface adhesin n=1 Tax=Sphaerochaeta pleomorpha (strain ATCC BAA-1885 / DSM 22778 / Grapes) TaxID=158190 RepID=G8QQG1_SPHPG|nr:zinc ABC transporter substrate-binding protein [Sphaerochaeta pleomorpha]AEV29806.1 ABC-type metal ion transport system, periplasmic component/surface adhesin [Sphaerochaeta pleomorpha str. Grapes]